MLNLKKKKVEMQLPFPLRFLMEGHTESKHGIMMSLVLNIIHSIHIEGTHDVQDCDIEEKIGTTPCQEIHGSPPQSHHLST